MPALFPNIASLNACGVPIVCPPKILAVLVCVAALAMARAAVAQHGYADVAPSTPAGAALPSPVPPGYGDGHMPNQAPAAPSYHANARYDLWGGNAANTNRAYQQNYGPAPPQNFAYGPTPPGYHGYGIGRGAGTVASPWGASTAEEESYTSYFDSNDADWTNVTPSYYAGSAQGYGQADYTANNSNPYASPVAVDASGTPYLLSPSDQEYLAQAAYHAGGGQGYYVDGNPYVGYASYYPDAWGNAGSPMNQKGPCGPDCGPGCDHFAACASRFFGRAEYLIWITKGRPSGPPLVTTSDPSTPPEDAGVIGLATTDVLFGGQNVDDNPQHGGRIMLGMWLDDCQAIGIVARAYAIEDDQVGFQASSDGTPILARPFFDAEIQQPASLLIAFENLVRGDIAISSSSSLSGGEFFARHLLCRGHSHRIDLIGGYQYNRIDDDLSIRHSLESLDPNFISPVGTTIDSIDSFEAENDFHGGVLGLQAQFRTGNLLVELLGKAAVGVVSQSVRIEGQSVVTTPDPGGTTTIRPGGLLTQQSNIGRYVDDEFTVVPEAGINLKYMVADKLIVGAGYNFMYWKHIAFAGDQIDFSVNLSQQVGPLLGEERPILPAIETSEYWAHGANIFVEWWR